MCMYQVSVFYGHCRLNFESRGLVRYVQGTFAKLRKSIVIFLMSVISHGTARLPLDGMS